MIGRTNFLVGLMIMVVGLSLAGPSLITSVRFRPVVGTIVDAFAEATDDGQVRLAVVYEFDILPGDHPAHAGPVVGLGYARCDRFGQLLPDLVLSDAEAERFINQVRAGRAQSRVYYQPGDPMHTVRAEIRPGADKLFLSMPHLGLLMVLSPPLTWMALLILRRPWKRTTSDEER